MSERMWGLGILVGCAAIVLSASVFPLSLAFSIATFAWFIIGGMNLHD